jgi:zinc/manganese transport system substrate-binding protein
MKPAPLKALVFSFLALSSLSLQAKEKKLQVITTFLPLYAHTQSITGDLADVSVLLGKETGPHNYELKPSDVQKLAKADLFIINGLGLEDWLESLLEKSANPKLLLVNTSTGVSLLDSPEEVELPSDPKTTHDHDHPGHVHDHNCKGHDDGKNPHIWLDPVIAQQQTRIILDALVKADPENAAAYRKNADTYLARLKKLDADFASTLGKLPNKNLITFHDAFPYLAKRYGLNYIGFIEEFPEKDPKPNQLAALVKAIKDNKVKVLFAESGYSTKLLESIAQQSGAGVASLNTLEIGEPAADAYLILMRENLQALEKTWNQ